jgi:cell division protein FtsB
MARRTRSRRRPVRSMRWLILGVAVLIGFLYYRPLSSYLETKQELERRTSELHELEEDRTALERRLARAEEPASVERQARRLGLVRPGERLFIVTGVDAWRRRTGKPLVPP